MNSIKKMQIKHNFFKLVQGHPDRKSEKWEDTNLYYFIWRISEYIEFLEKHLEDSLNTLFLDIDLKVKVDRKRSDKDKLVFYNESDSKEVYMLVGDHINVVSSNGSEHAENDMNQLPEKLGRIYTYYKCIVDNFTEQEIPLTERTSWCYDFFEKGHYILKDKRKSNQVKLFTYVDEQEFADTDERCYYDWKFFEVLDKRIIIPTQYSEKFNTLKEYLSNCENELLKDIDEEIEEQQRNISIALNIEEEIEKKHLEILQLQEKLEQVSGQATRTIIPEENLFVTIDEVKCVKDCWKPYLRFIDLHNISFDDVYIAGLDFSYCNAKINPQTVYNRDLSNCRFISYSKEEWAFSPSADFSGCNITGSYIDDAPINFGIKPTNNNKVTLNK